MADEQQKKRRPDYRAYQVKPPSREGAKPRWLELGAAWTHDDAKGLTVRIELLPAVHLGDALEIVLRERSEPHPTPPEESA